MFVFTAGEGVGAVVSILVMVAILGVMLSAMRDRRAGGDPSGRRRGRREGFPPVAGGPGRSWSGVSAECPNADCRALNRLHARFCRLCGTALR